MVQVPDEMERDPVVHVHHREKDHINDQLHKVWEGGEKKEKGEDNGIFVEIG